MRHRPSRKREHSRPPATYPSPVFLSFLPFLCLGKSAVKSWRICLEGLDQDNLLTPGALSTGTPKPPGGCRVGMKAAGRVGNQGVSSA